MARPPLARSQLGAQLVNGKSLESDRSVTSDGKHYRFVGLADGAPTNGARLVSCWENVPFQLEELRRLK
jgi:hypothetical protein